MNNPAKATPQATLVADQLADSLEGELILPGQPEYEMARRPWNRAYDPHPVAIVRCRSTDDVINAVNFARDNDLPLSVRSGGHGASGLCVVDKGVVIDLSLMNKMTVDPEARVAVAEAGLTWGDYIKTTSEHGLVTPAGDSGSVGLGGLTLGGGIGWLVRKYGLTIDHLISAEIVTADGSLITAGETEHADLFWALRGGGGNFGVVTSFKFGLVPVGTVYAGMLAFSATPDTVTNYLKIASEAPEELSAIAMMMLAPPMPMMPAEYVGKPILMILMCYAGNPQEGESAVAPIRALSTPIAQMVGPMPYIALYKFTEESSTSGPACVRSVFLDGLDEATAAALIEQLEHATSPASIIQFRALGGAMARVDQGATAFGHRDKPYLTTIINSWMDPAASSEEVAKHRAWNQAVWQTLQPHAVGAYVNFLGEEGDDAVRQAYPPATYERLAQIKKQYDPNNLFRSNRNIPPAEA